MANLPSINLLNKTNTPYKPITLPRPPKSASDIVELYGCPLDQIIKTLLFIADKPVLACVPGDCNVNIDKLSRATGMTNLKLANSKEISELTGFELGGVSPFLDETAHPTILTVIDSSCFLKDTINIGAGTKTMGIELTTHDLKKIWPGIIDSII